MCGIVGMVTTTKQGFNLVHKRIFKALLFVDTLRGDDSTGIFGIRESGNVDFVKETSAAPSFLESKEYTEFDNQIFSSYRMCVGHNRKATRGATSDENAHPFVEGETILIHNGTITNQHKLTDKLTQVDSHAILHSIVERGEIQTLKEIEGAFTLVWYNTKEQELKLIRNEERPLYIANTEDAWYFASEKGMLQWIIERENEKIVSLIEAEAGKLYIFKLSDDKNMWIRPMTLYKPKKQTKPNLVVIENPAQSPSSTDPSIFKCNSKILITGTKLVTTNKNKLLIEGTWFYDKDIIVRCWITQEILETLSDTPFTGAKDGDEVLFRGKISQIITHNNKVTIICDTASPYIPTFDLLGNEILEDDYIFTDQLCSYCTKKTTFESLIDKGIFRFKTEEDFETICPTCCTIGKHK